MITEFKKYLLNESTKFKESEYDLVIVDVQEGFKKFFGEEYLLALEEYCENFTRVFQIFDTNNTNHSDYIFPNQTLEIEKTYGGQLDEEDIDYLFTEPMRDYVRSKMNNLQERDIFETINGDYYVYVDAAHEWFFCTKEMADLFKKFKSENRKIMLVGGAGGSKKNPKGECLRDIYVTLKAFGVDTRYNLDYVYSADGNMFKSNIKGVPLTDEQRNKVKSTNENYNNDDIINLKTFDFTTLFNTINKECFNSSLSIIPIKFSTSKSYTAQFVRPRYPKYDGTDKEYFVFSTLFEMTYKKLKNVLAHEMIHYYLYAIMDRDKSHHGYSFQNKMNSINNLNLGYIITLKDDEPSNVSEENLNKKLQKKKFITYKIKGQNGYSLINEITFIKDKANFLSKRTMYGVTDIKVYDTSSAHYKVLSGSTTKIKLSIIKPQYQYLIDNIINDTKNTKFLYNL